MGRRRTTAKMQQNKRHGQTAPASEGWDDSDFPVDDPAPDDLPVRDIADEDERNPASGEEVGSAETFARDSVSAASGLERDGGESRSATFGHKYVPAPNGGMHRDPAVGVSASEPLALPETAEPPIQSLFPNFELGDVAAAHVQHDGKQATRPRRPRDLSLKKTLRAAQIEMWPDDENSASRS